MEPERYLELLERDGTRLVAVARVAELEAPIPTCPGWTVGDCLIHVAEVYQHKIACIRLGRSPGADYQQAPPGGVDAFAWFDASLLVLVDELRARGPAAPAYSWWPPDQSVGFWYRRMAQETAVHRLDIEDGAGTPTPLDADLALDGIDEVLDPFLADDWADVTADEWGDVDPQAGAGKSIVVRSGDRAWRSTLQADAIPIERLDPAAPSTSGDATVVGDPESVLLWLFGRRGDDVVELAGDPDVLIAFRDRLTIATQ
jgi:uncharacterized protein (TIGR03083 family)